MAPGRLLARGARHVRARDSAGPARWPTEASRKSGTALGPGPRPRPPRDPPRPPARLSQLRAYTARRGRRGSGRPRPRRRQPVARRPDPPAHVVAHLSALRHDSIRTSQDVCLVRAWLEAVFGARHGAPPPSPTAVCRTCPGRRVVAGRGRHVPPAKLALV